jgi:hypothetical protein
VAVAGRGARVQGAGGRTGEEPGRQGGPGRGSVSAAGAVFGGAVSFVAQPRRGARAGAAAGAAPARAAAAAGGWRRGPARAARACLQGVIRRRGAEIAARRAAPEIASQWGLMQPRCRSAARPRRGRALGAGAAPSGGRVPRWALRGPQTASCAANEAAGPATGSQPAAAGAPPRAGGWRHAKKKKKGSASLRRAGPGRSQPRRASRAVCVCGGAGGFCADQKRRPRHGVRIPDSSS